MARVLGLYLAEGCKGNYGVIWSFGEIEEYLADEVISVLKEYNLHATKKLQITEGTYGLSRCWVVRCRTHGLRVLLDLLKMGSNSHDKRLPINLSDDLLLHTIGGWIDGDGSFTDTTLSAYSDSKELIKDIDRVLLSNEILPCLSKNGHIIKISMKNDVKHMKKYLNRVNVSQYEYKREKENESPNMRKTKNGWFIRITEKELLGSNTVVGLETESHTYIANSILTHNCLPKDINNLVWFFKNRGGEEAKLMEFILKYNAEMRKDSKNTVPLVGEEV
jgi:hypothetical protein